VKDGPQKVVKDAEPRGKDPVPHHGHGHHRRNIGHEKEPPEKRYPRNLLVYQKGQDQSADHDAWHIEGSKDEGVPDDEPELIRAKHLLIVVRPKPVRRRGHLPPPEAVHGDG